VRENVSPDPDRIATQQDLGRELTAVTARAGLTVRQAARAAGQHGRRVLSGRHLPADGRPGFILDRRKD
jgi:hypothetical protein